MFDDGSEDNLYDQLPQRMAPAYVNTEINHSIPARAIELIESVIDGADMCASEPLTVAQLKGLFLDTIQEGITLDELHFSGTAEDLLSLAEKEGVLTFTPLIHAKPEPLLVGAATQTVFDTWYNSLLPHMKSKVGSAMHESYYLDDELLRAVHSDEPDELAKKRRISALTEAKQNAQAAVTSLCTEYGYPNPMDHHRPKEAKQSESATILSVCAEWKLNCGDKLSAVQLCTEASKELATTHGIKVSNLALLCALDGGSEKEINHILLQDEAVKDLQASKIFEHSPVVAMFPGTTPKRSR